MSTTTFLFTDIEGSTKLWESHGDAMGDALAVHDGIIERRVVEVGGTVFKHLGDGVAAVFDSAEAAARCAAAITEDLSNAATNEVRLRARMGLHTGEVTRRGDDYFGPTLNRTARIMDAGHGGQVLVSTVTRELLRGSELELTDLGEYRLRDLGEPERIFQLVVDAAAADFPALRTPDLRPNNLPSQLTSFVGRDRELGELADLVAGHRLVTVTGVGGVGKTRVALHVAADIAHRFPGGTWLVRLAAITDPEQVDVAFVEALGVAQPEDLSPREALKEHVEHLRALLVVDNCEHVIGAAAPVVAELLEAGPDLHVIATSRELLGVPGEVAYGLASLPLVSDEGAADAITLFDERARSSHPRFELGDHLDAVEDICRRLDGIPLAIELAAVRVRSLSPERLASMLDEGFRLLTGGRRTTLPRQQTLEATIEWSFRLLDETDQAVFARLGAFRGPFSLEAAQAVATADLDDWAVVDAVMSLVDKSLVSADSDADRFWLLETIRQFAAERLADSGSADEYRRRHAAHYAELMAEVDHAYDHAFEFEAPRRVEAELDNVRQALSWAVGAGEGNLAMDLAMGFGRWRPAGLWPEAMQWWEAADAIAPPDEGLNRAVRLGRQGALWAYSDATDDALAMLAESNDILHSLEQSEPEVQWRLGRNRFNEAIMRYYRGEAGERNEHFQRWMQDALRHSERAGDALLSAAILGNLAHHRDPQGDPDEARGLFDQAKAALGALGHGRLAGLAWQRARFEFHVRAYDASVDAYREAVALESAVEAALRGDLVGLALAERALGVDGANHRIQEAIDESLDALGPKLVGQQAVVQTLILGRAAVDLDRGDLENVARLAGASEAEARRGAPMPWDLIDHFEEVVDAARSRLGDTFDDVFRRFVEVDRQGLADLLRGP